MSFRFDSADEGVGGKNMRPPNTRIADLSPNMEDYLETIYLQDLEGSTAKVKNIAEKMGVSKPSVTEALSVLKDRGLVLHQKYGDVELTERGREAASHIYYRHRLFLELFHNVLGVPEDVAEEDACRVEHLVSDTTVRHCTALMKLIGEQAANQGPYAGFVNMVHKTVRDMKSENGNSGKKKK
ncbi:metal-dependent transcriptional regulator [bacterium]|nr:metal-dependent transcriptional regulator [bacterium]